MELACLDVHAEGYQTSIKRLEDKIAEAKKLECKIIELESLQAFEGKALILVLGGKNSYEGRGGSSGAAVERK